MLYRKYRPQVFAQVVGQEHVIRTLKGGFSNNRVGHAFLFSGPRGTGKTSVARILAKALNCPNRAKDGEPCNACDFCRAVNEGRSLDLIEIDGASNGRVDEIRTLKESATVSAPTGQYKVFIIDEVHMVTPAAFNALLKLLEEPPAHVVFVFATTDPHKIPPTVLSRVQRFDFHKLTPSQISAKLKEVAKTEQVEIDDEALAVLALASDGALRDAEVSFSKVISSCPAGAQISAQDVQDILGLIPLRYHPEFFGYLIAKDRPAALTFIQNIYHSGVSLEHFSKDFLEYLRKVLLMKVSPAMLAAAGQDSADGQYLGQHAAAVDQERLIRMIIAFTNARAELKFSPIPQLPLELAVLELTQ